MRLHIDFNPRKLFKDFGILESKLDKNLNKAVRQAALLIQSESKKNIQKGPRSGRLYKTWGNPRSGRARTPGAYHRASAPGEYPKTDTGYLVAHIGIKYGRKYASVGTDVPYGEYLENKTPRAGGRPWLKRTYNENTGKLQAIFERNMRDSLK